MADEEDEEKFENEGEVPAADTPEGEGAEGTTVKEEELERGEEELEGKEEEVAGGNQEEPETEGGAEPPLRVGGTQALGNVNPKRLIEAALFISSKPLSLADLGKLIGVASPGFVDQLAKELAADYARGGLSVTIVKETDGYAMRIKAEYAGKVAEFAKEAELSKGALKILAYVSQNEGIEQSKLANSLGSTVYDYVGELCGKGFVEKRKKGRTSVLKTTQKFKDYFGA